MAAMAFELLATRLDELQSQVSQELENPVICGVFIVQACVNMLTTLCYFTSPPPRPPL